jgi:hypothetical protein
MYRPVMQSDDRVTLTFTRAALESFIQFLNDAAIMQDGYRLHWWVVTYADNEASIGNTLVRLDEE